MQVMVTMASKLRTLFPRLALAAGALFLGIQLVPYGRDHRNPPVVSEPHWNSRLARALAARACFDCHSNETRWPWYSNVAPVSWMLQRHVGQGRRALNFSEWQGAHEEVSEVAESVNEGKMPLRGYALMHRDARLSPSEKQALVQGLRSALGEEGQGQESARAPRRVSGGAQAFSMP
jgi:heme-binding protein